VGIPVQQLPNVVAWNDPVLPRPKPKAFVTPGTPQTAPEKPPELTAPPTLQVSSRSGAPSTVNLGPAPAPPPRPKLVLPQSKSAPLRIPDALPELQDGEIGTRTGDPTNLIIMSGLVGKPNELVAVPPGSNVPRTVAEGTVTGAGRSGSGSPNGAGTGSGLGSGTAFGAGSGAGGGSAKGGGGTGASGKNGAGNGAGSGPGAGAGGTGAGAANSPGGIGVSGAGSLGSSTKMASVINLSPAPPPAAAPMPAPAARRGPVKPGVFDVVVVQSAEVETQFRSFGILKGKPIYTVYLQLNTPKAWILQYCLPPPAGGASALSGVVRLHDPQPVTPPYPLATVLSEVELQPKSSYTLIHGFLTADGRFRNMTLMGKVDPQLTRLLQLLEKWEFRPSMQVERPVEVEVLLAIPPA